MKTYRTAIILAAVVIAAITVTITVWYRLHHIYPQPDTATNTPGNDYFYGSVGAGKTPGIPYWIWLAMPRIFPEHVKLPGGVPVPGGYAAFNLAWEEGIEMPVGFAKQRVGYIRVSGNCALCHVIRGPVQDKQIPQITQAAAGKITDVKPLLAFFQACAADPGFNAAELFNEVDSDTSLSLWDKALYKYVLIPRTRRMLLQNPAQALFSPAILAHLRDPKSEAPFSDPEMRRLRDYVRQQSSSTTP
jgi:hypothetical protein